MLDAVFLAALFCGCIAALKGYRTSWFLLASTAFTSALSLLGMKFDPFFWMLIDVAVVMAIAGPKMTRCDAVIIALFIPVWSSYFLDNWTAYYVASFVVSLQFLLVFPIPQLWGGCARRLGTTSPSDNLEMARA